MAEKSLNIKSRFEDNRSNTSVKIDESGIQVPVEIQSRYSKTVQTHANVVISPNGSNVGSWIDSNGFDKLSITMNSDSLHSTRCAVYWSNDGTTNHGYEPDAIPTSSVSSQRAGIVDTKARYFRLVIFNSDGSLPHTMSAWAYLKS